MPRGGPAIRPQSTWASLRKARTPVGEELPSPRCCWCCSGFPVGFGGSSKSDEVGALPTQDRCVGPLSETNYHHFLGVSCPEWGRKQGLQILCPLSAHPPPPLPPLLDLPLPCPTTDLKHEVHSQADLPATTTQGWESRDTGCALPRTEGQIWRHPAPRGGRWGSAARQPLTFISKELHSDGPRSSQPPCFVTVLLLPPDLTEKETEAQEG